MKKKLSTVVTLVISIKTSGGNFLLELLNEPKSRIISVLALVSVILFYPFEFKFFIFSFFFFIGK